MYSKLKPTPPPDWWRIWRNRYILGGGDGIHVPRRRALLYFRQGLTPEEAAELCLLTPVDLPPDPPHPKPPPKPRGRKKGQKMTNKPRIYYLHIRLTEKEHAALLRCAERCRLTTSKYVRNCVFGLATTK